MLNLKSPKMNPHLSKKKENLYKSLRVEHHAWQCTDKWKQVLSETITRKKPQRLNCWNRKSAAKTEIEKTQIELSNSKLQADLLSNLEIFSKELALSRHMLSSSKAALKGLKYDKENPDNWTIKKCKVSINDVKKWTGIHIKLCHGEEQPRVNISVHVDF